MKIKNSEITNEKKLYEKNIKVLSRFCLMSSERLDKSFFLKANALSLKDKKNDNYKKVMMKDKKESDDCLWMFITGCNCVGETYIDLCLCKKLKIIEYRKCYVINDNCLFLKYENGEYIDANEEKYEGTVNDFVVLLKIEV